MFRFAMVLASAGLVGACMTDDDQVVCTLEARAGINVDVVDAATGAPVEGATGTAREGAFAETLQSLQPGRLFGVFERKGIYEVIVSAPGYRMWRVESIRVNADECHVIPIRLEARLDREP